MPARLPPGPPLPTAVQTLLWIRRPIPFMEGCRSRYGGTFTIRLPPSAITFFSDPQAIRQIFTAKGDEMHAGEVYRLLQAVLGDHSVLSLDGAEHMRQRRLMLPSFHGERMRLYGATMREVAERDIDTWPKGEAFSLHPHMQHVTLEVILRTVFGIDEGAELVELGEHLKRLLARGEFPISVFVLYLLSAKPERQRKVPWKWLLEARDKADALVYRQISARRAEASTAERTDVLAMLLQARDESGRPMTDTELRDELITLLVAGHETTATALCWAFERVLSHPEVHARLLEELRAVNGGDVPTPEQIQRLDYLDAVVKETLRLRPIIPIVARVLKKPATIGGYDLPVGATASPCIYLAHRNPAVYSNPEAFDPDRFLGVQPDPYAWLPFGGGIRRCLGAAFALYEMKIVMATILSKMDLVLAQAAPIPTVRRSITFSPKGGTRVAARPRAA